MSTTNDRNRETQPLKGAQTEIVELVRQAKQGDVEAFQSLYQRFVNRVLSFVYRMTGSQNEAEDIVQDTFVAAYQNIAELKEEAKFQSWLFTIARNNVYQTFRARGHPTVSLDNPTHEDDLPEADRVTAKDKTPEEAALSDELREIIQSTLTELSDKQREAFVLSALKDFSYEQIAEIVGRSVAAIKMDIHRARLVVRNKVKKYLKYN